jgi:hypothetical protein
MANRKLRTQKVLTRTKREWAGVDSVNLDPELDITVISSVQCPCSQPILQAWTAMQSLQSFVYYNTIYKVRLTPWTFVLMLEHLVISE